MSEKLTILHFNDVYNIEGQKDEPRGGAARMQTYIKSQQGLDPLLLFSGDALNPSLMSIFFKGDQMIPVLNNLGVAAAVYGNHDFDYGVDHLEEFAEQCKFPWLMSNVKDIVNNEPLARGETYTIIDHAGVKVGVIGLVEEEWIDTLSTIDPDDIMFVDFVEAGTHLSSLLKQQGCELIVALTHMRVPNDKKLAESVPDIDIVLGGHDHEYEVFKAGDKYVVKSGTDFREMSKITMTRSSTGSWKADVERVELDSCVEEDPDMKDVIADRLASVDEKMDTHLGHMNVDMDGRFASVRTQETNLGNFVCDIMLTATKADCALMNSGTFRSDRIHLKGDFKIRDLLTILPMMDNCVVIKVTGAQLVEALENGVSKYPVKEGRFPQIAGLAFGFDPTRPSGQRVGRQLVKVRGEFIDLDRDYRLATKEYLAIGKDGYDCFKDCEIVESAEQCPALSTMVQNHFESVAIHQGQIKCRSGHRQSLVALTMRDDLTKMLHANSEHEHDHEHEEPPKRLVRQESIHCLESEQNFLAPKVEGRIYILTEEKRHVMQSLMPSGLVRNLSMVKEEPGSQSWSSMSQTSQDEPS